ncbi:MAG: 5-(carboxyamino)imidazole ribonucleotide mutase [Candidatus Korarchaeota archaeon]|nr:5-(carboxyamino)imidazole ribonucleotide mutase [Candidatus Korarchaeota archaeon]NIU85041.1 5-(carboxyamino)imidazole ribonucleotide mutase [Candidatus Thorarchaeota archaeon]NIW15066.1 5-(carboxyamino)imidazole ribonucleotide mutase [Candidatus Thorarchaeota archaeon]NIW53076.1 5-(carboxyamino)imidazole ribonucleotide mutase [Candidatus Korarchaeota archaeon]
MNRQAPRVSIIMGSDSDRDVAEKAVAVLEEEGIPYEVKVISAHRNPGKLDDYVKKTKAKVFIAVAGLSAALPGVIASKTKKPVIGVPVSAKLGGLDALLSIVQMPPGVPVAAVGIDNAQNAAYLALRILALIDVEHEK